MFKLLIVLLILVVVFIGGIAVGLYQFYGWKGLIALPFVLFALMRIATWIGRPILKRFAGRFALGLMSEKSEVLQKATVAVHSISPVPVPALLEGEKEPT